jgi:hypothetical protein
VRRAGEPDRDALRRRAAHAGPIDEGTLVYRIEFHTHELDCIDFDLTRTDRVETALLDPCPLPQSHGDRDVAGQDVVAQLAAELHARDVSCGV